MTVYRVGLISDTHVPEFLPELPAGIAEAFRGVDLILHAGDITELSTLDQLGAIAPVVAVKGNHDDHLDLPLQRVVEVGQVRIGLIHGHRSRLREAPGVAWNESLGGYGFWFNGIERHLLGAFRGEAEPVDAIVFGHYHRAYERKVDGTLLVNPGGVYHGIRSEARKRLPYGPPHHRLYFLNRIRFPQAPQTIAVMTVEGRRMSVEVVTLPGVPRP